jgi:hypothetical protein
MKEEDFINLPYGGSRGQIIANRILNLQSVNISNYCTLFRTLNCLCVNYSYIFRSSSDHHQGVNLHLANYSFTHLHFVKSAEQARVQRMGKLPHSKDAGTKV